MILKSYIVEKDHKILSKFKSVLMYGENQGIKEDIKERPKMNFSSFLSLGREAGERHLIMKERI